MLSTTACRNDYTGNSSASVFAYGWRIFLAADLVVTVTKTADGTTTTLTLTTDYTVSGIGATAGGNVTLVNAAQAWLSGGNLATGYTMTIRRVRPVTQTTDIRNQGSFFPETHEDEFDTLTMVDQQQQDQLDRSVRIPVSIAPSGFSCELPATIAQFPGSAIIVNSLGTGLTVGPDTGAMARIFGRDTYANLKAAAAAAPTLTRMGWATDIQAEVFYCADTSIGDGGWIVRGGG